MLLCIAAVKTGIWNHGSSANQDVENRHTERGRTAYDLLRCGCIRNNKSSHGAPLRNDANEQTRTAQNTRAQSRWPEQREPTKAPRRPSDLPSNRVAAGARAISLLVGGRWFALLHQEVERPGPRPVLVGSWKVGREVICATGVFCRPQLQGKRSSPPSHERRQTPGIDMVGVVLRPSRKREFAQSLSNPQGGSLLCRMHPGRFASKVLQCLGLGLHTHGCVAGAARKLVLPSGSSVRCPGCGPTSRMATGAPCV